MLDVAANKMHFDKGFSPIKSSRKPKCTEMKAHVDAEKVKTYSHNASEIIASRTPDQSQQGHTCMWLMKSTASCQTWSCVNMTAVTFAIVAEEFSQRNWSNLAYFGR